MKIDRFEVYAVSIPYKKPFTNSWGTVATGDHVILKLFADGLVGLGEAAVIMPDKGGEDQTSIADILVRCFGPALLGEDPFNVEGIMRKLDGMAATKYAYLYTKAAIDSALYDLMGLSTGRPVCDLLGGRTRSAIEAGWAIGTAPPEKMADTARHMKEMGYRFLTVKVDGKDYPTDVARVRAVREALGDDFMIDVDPNQAYPASECIPALKKMEAFDIAGVEQPCPAWDYDGMAKVADALDVPVAMDEGLITPADAHKIVHMKAADIFTLKLAKSGGYYYTKRIVAIGEAAGMGFGMGSMHTFGVGTAAILHFVSATPEVAEPIGYGTPLDRFSDDILTTPIQIQDGIITVPSGPGLGVGLDDEKMKKYGNLVGAA